MEKNSSRFQSSARSVSASLQNSRQSFTPEQLPLYRGAAPAPGSMNDDGTIRAIIADCIRQCTKSREQIADEMSHLVGEKITVRMLNSYTSEAAEQHRWPSQFTRAFCLVVQDWSLLRCIVERAGFYLIDEVEADLLELGRQTAARKAADEAIANLEIKLRGVKL